MARDVLCDMLNLVKYAPHNLTYPHQIISTRPQRICLVPWYLLGMHICAGEDLAGEAAPLSSISYGSDQWRCTATQVSLRHMDYRLLLSVTVLLTTVCYLMSSY